jgi:hypothetical protein
MPRCLDSLSSDSSRTTISEWRNLQFVERGAGIGGTLACLLQHRPATLGAWLQATSAGSMAGRIFPAVWESGKQRTLPTFPHRLLPRRADISLSRSATLTISLVQITGQAGVWNSSERNATNRSSAMFAFDSHICRDRDLLDFQTVLKHLAKGGWWKNSSRL